jgi:hypothetical protein
VLLSSFVLTNRRSEVVLRLAKGHFWLSRPHTTRFHLTESPFLAFTFSSSPNPLHKLLFPPFRAILRLSAPLPALPSWSKRPASSKYLKRHPPRPSFLLSSSPPRLAQHRRIVNNSRPPSSVVSLLSRCVSFGLGDLGCLESVLHVAPLLRSGQAWKHRAREVHSMRRLV